MHRWMLTACLALVGGLGLTDNGWAGGRTITGGHPYHNGYYFMPPASAYDMSGIRPPYRYGVPMYYFPQSYLNVPSYSYYPPGVYPGSWAYGTNAMDWGTPYGEAAGFYMQSQYPGTYYPLPQEYPYWGR